MEIQHKHSSNFPVVFLSFIFTAEAEEPTQFRLVLMTGEYEKKKKVIWVE